jgi:DNA-directed RNA polymerase sigma subunit (sigma70/sigma32)
MSHNCRKPNERLEEGLLDAAIDQMLAALPLRHKQIIELRYGLKDGRVHTLEEIGQGLSLTKERVRQIANDVLSRLQFSKNRRRVIGLLDFALDLKQANPDWFFGAFCCGSHWADQP